MKYILLFFQILFFSSVAIGQVITVKVVDGYEYQSKPNSYSVRISEDVSAGDLENKTPEERKSEFDTKVLSVFKYLKDKKIDHTHITGKGKEEEVLLPNSIFFLNLELRTPIAEIEKFESFIASREGLMFFNHDTSISIDDAFFKECLDKLTRKAENEARAFAIAMNREIGELKEMNIIKYQVNKIDRRYQTNKNVTHGALFEIEFSFDTE